MPPCRAALIGLLLAAVAVVSPAGASAAIRPDLDPFYEPPADLAGLAPGDVIRSRSIRVQTLPGIRLPYKTYQVLYRTSNTQDQPIAVAATIMLPLKGPKTGRKLVSYQTAYDGLSPQCQPSYSLQTGRVALQGAETLLMSSLLGKGWTVVTADYEGPENAFSAGKVSAHGVLDGIRAAERFGPALLDQGSATQVGMMGFSGGGLATAWANELRASYAPELNIVGAAQGGIPVDLEHVYDHMNGGLLTGVLFASIVGLSQAYPESNFEQYLNDRGRAAFRKVRKLCISDYFYQYPFANVKDYVTVPDLFEMPSVKAVVDDNTLGRTAPSIPTMMYMAKHDEMGSFADARNLARSYCRRGTPMQFVRVDAEDHVSLAITGPVRVQAYLSQRFNGAPAQTNCDVLLAGGG